MKPSRLERMHQVAANRIGWVRCAVEHIYHRHNASAVCRTADALGIHTVHAVGTPAFQPARGVASGAARWLDLRHHKTPTEAITALRAEGCALWVADFADPPTAPAQVPLDRPVCVWFGAELAGVGPEARAAADGVITLPMRGFVQSLNISVAAALILHTLAERALAQHGDAALLSPEAREALTARWMAREA